MMKVKYIYYPAWLRSAWMTYSAERNVLHPHVFINEMKRTKYRRLHYDDVIMTMLASQITSLTVVYSIVYSGVNQRKHQSSASLAFVWEIHRGPVNFPHKWPVTRKMFPFDDVIMEWADIFTRTFKVVRKTKLQSFQFKLVHRVINCNKKVFDMKIKASPQY